MEAMAAIGVASLLMALGIGLLHQLLKLDRSGRAAVAEAASLGRLGRTLRDDLRAATAPPEIEGDSARWTLPDGRAVVYAWTGQAVERHEPAAGDRLSRSETFRLPARTEARWESGPGTLAIVLRSADDRRVASWLDGYRIEARIGADRRFDGGRAREERP